MHQCCWALGVLWELWQFVGECGAVLRIPGFLEPWRALAGERWRVLAELSAARNKWKFKLQSKIHQKLEVWLPHTPDADTNSGEPGNSFPCPCRGLILGIVMLLSHFPLNGAWDLYKHWGGVKTTKFEYHWYMLGFYTIANPGTG